MNTSFYVELALYAGEILLRNGSEAFRVEDTMQRILKHYGYPVVEVITTTTGIYVCVIDSEGVATTLLTRVHNRTIDLNNITEVNSISRKICEDKISAPDAYKSLIDVQKSVTYSDKVLISSWALSCFGFAYILNNSFREAIVTLPIAFIAGIFAIKLKKNFNRITYPFAVSAFTAFLAILASTIFGGVLMDDIIISGIMPILPGVALVNTVRDVLSGDYLCAGSRFLEVVVVATCIALGVGLSLSIYFYLGV